MSTNLRTALLSLVLINLCQTGLASVYTRCAETSIRAEYQSDIPAHDVEMPYGFWKLNNYEIRVEKRTLLRILDIREARISRAGLQSHGSIYLRDRINSLPEDQWPVDMASLAPPRSAWENVTKPEPTVDNYLETEFYKLSMQQGEHSILLENALYHGLVKVIGSEGGSPRYIKQFRFEEKLEDESVATGYVWVDPDNTEIYASCLVDPGGK